MADEKKNNSNIREKTHESVDSVIDKAEGVGEKGKEKITHLKEKVIHAKKNVDNYILKNPEKSVLIAVAIGVATGAILTRKFMKKKNKSEGG